MKKYLILTLLLAVSPALNAMAVNWTWTRPAVPTEGFCSMSNFLADSSGGCVIVLSLTGDDGNTTGSQVVWLSSAGKVKYSLSLPNENAELIMAEPNSFIIKISSGFSYSSTSIQQVKAAGAR